MPNWCDQDIVIVGPKDYLEKFSEIEFSLNRFIPMPHELKGIVSGSDSLGYSVKYGSKKDFDNILSYPWIEGTTREEVYAFLEKHRPFATEKTELYKLNMDRYGFIDWYTWANHNWGVKWDINPIKLKVKDNKIEFSISTAWCWPEPVYLKASREFPNLTFDIRYFESGMGFQGKMIIKNGIKLETSHKEYHGTRGG